MDVAPFSAIFFTVLHVLTGEMSLKFSASRHAKGPGCEYGILRDERRKSAGKACTKDQQSLGESVMKF